MKKRGFVLKIVAALVAWMLLTATMLGVLGCSRGDKSADLDFPRLDIVTHNGSPILSREEYVSCAVSLAETDEAYCFEGLSAEIRGRGNVSWEMYPKRPYRLRFTKDTSLFGEKSQKNWVLLALYNDFSFSKDRLAFGMAERLGASFAPCYHYVELYINDSYMGLYLLTDQVEEARGRVNVQYGFDADTVEVPFLVELDAYAPREGVEGVDWFAVGGFSYSVKYPNDKERYTDAQFDFIKGYIETVDALCRRDGVTMAELAEYIDMASFIDYYIVQEAMGQAEINWKSVYMSRTHDGVLVMGPVWDFDWSVTGPCVGKDKGIYQDASGFRSNQNWFIALYRNSPEFRAALSARWSEVRDDILAEIDELESEKQLIAEVAKRDQRKWHWFRVDCSYDTYFDEVIDWCRRRVAWLDGELGYQP